MRGGPELLVELDRAGPEPLHRQLADGLRTAIRTGRLAPHTRMPSTRVLAADLGVSRRLVVDAYSQLVAEGFLLSRHGSGTRVATVDAASAPQHAEPTRRFDVDFLPGSPDLSSFPRTAWLRALRQALAEIGSDSFGYVDPQGLPAARAAVADYLRRTRGVQADAQHVVLCSGATQAIALLARALRRQRAAAGDGGPRILAASDGVAPQRYRADSPFRSTTTASTSPRWPPAARRLCCPRPRTSRRPASCSPPPGAPRYWNGRAPATWSIEDDYDAEYRYDRAPVGALQGIAPDRVIYVGSTSKTLAPGLRIGWMVMPPQLVGAVRLSKSLADTGSSVMDQLAFAQLLTSGGYDRHLRQMRRRYLTRRNALLEALARHLPQATVLGAAAGVHLTVRFPDGYPIADLVRRAAAMRVNVEPLAPCYADPATAPPGLLLGYANLTESQINAGVAALARAAR